MSSAEMLPRVLSVNKFNFLVQVHKYDRVVVGGSAHTVTPGGYTMGGGHSPISRTFGLAVDNLLEIQVNISLYRTSYSNTTCILPVWEYIMKTIDS